MPVYDLAVFGDNEPLPNSLSHYNLDNNNGSSGTCLLAIKEIFRGDISRNSRSKGTVVN